MIFVTLERGIIYTCHFFTGASEARIFLGEATSFPRFFPLKLVRALNKVVVEGVPLRNGNKPHSLFFVCLFVCLFFFCRIPVVIESRRSSQGTKVAGVMRTPCTLPQDPFLLLISSRSFCLSFGSS